MLSLKNVAIFSLAFILAGCSSLEVETSKHRPNYYFDKLQSYSWHEDTKTPLDIGPESKFHGLIQNSIRNELQQKGYSLKDKGDFYVNFSISKDVKALYGEYKTYAGFDPSFRVYKGGEVSRAVDREYTDKEKYSDYIPYGSIVIDIIDPKSNRLVWRASVKKELDGTLSMAEATELIKSAVKKGLTNFPNKK